jgi:uncharacterized protein
MRQHWKWITFLHWRYRPETIQPMLPEALTVETCDGSAWVGVTPFLMHGLRVPGLPAVPWLSEFPETNVRTYVHDDRGRSGLCFLSLDAARLPAVLAARAGYWLPYFWSDMTVRVSGGCITYRSRRRWAAPGSAHCDAQTRLAEALSDPECSPLVHFLTARYRLFTRIAGRLAAAEVEHPLWPLHRAELLGLEQNLLTEAGLPAPPGDPLAHASPGVPVRVGMWHR